MYYFIEPMTEDDIPYVQAIESQSFTTPWASTTYRRELRNLQSCRYVVARESSIPPPRSHPRPSPPLPLPILLLNQVAAALFPRPPSPSVAYPIIGYGGVWLVVDEAHITTIAVAPPYRGRGVGELLLNALIDHAYALAAQRMTLEVRVSNTTAQRLYLKYGFQIAGTRPRYYTDNGEDALIMWTDLIDSVEYKSRLGELRRRLVERLQRDTERQS